MIEQRLKRAIQEIGHYQEYDYLIINEDLSVATRELQSIIVSARCRMIARINSAQSIYASFGGIDAENP